MAGKVRIKVSRNKLGKTLKIKRKKPVKKKHKMTKGEALA